MDNIEKIEKWAILKKKGIITDKEFQEQKKALFSKPKYGNKSQLCYVLLAFFFGVLGIHNFYAGRWKQGLAQVLIPVLTLFYGSFITVIWVIVNIFAVHTDGKGNEFQPCKVAQIICGILGLIGYLSIFIVGGIAGYTMAMNKYKANEIMSYVAQVQILSQASNYGKGISEVQTCESLYGSSQITSELSSCFVFPDAHVQITVNQEGIKNAVKNMVQIQEKQDGSLIITHS